MKITKQTAIKFLVALGFTKAGDWADKKIVARLAQAHEKVEDVPEGFEELMDELKAAAEVGTEVQLEAEPEDHDEEDAPAPKKKVKPAAQVEEDEDEDLSAMSKKELLVLIEEEQLDVTPGKKATTIEIVQLINKARLVKSPAKTGRASRVSKKDPIEKDDIGSRVGSIASKVNACLSKDWVTDREIAEKTGLKLRQVRARLYVAAEGGVVQAERLIRYRISPATSE